jgi:hypothetical protein
MTRAKRKQPWSVTKKKKRSSAGATTEDREGVFALLYERHPVLAERETRTLYVFDREGIPAGEYAFAESFCMGSTCDCRRVMFMVYHRDGSQDVPQHILTIGYGWETLEFYIDWMYGDREDGLITKGPDIEINSPFCPYGDQLLALFKETCLSSPEYVDRVGRHYELFKGFKRRS